MGSGVGLWGRDAEMRARSGRQWLPGQGARLVKGLDKHAWNTGTTACAGRHFAVPRPWKEPGLASWTSTGGGGFQGGGVTGAEEQEGASQGTSQWIQMSFL